MKSNSSYQLQKYVNSGCLDAMDKFLFLLSPKSVFRKNAKAIQSMVRQQEMNKGAADLQIKIPEYEGSNKFVKELLEFLEKNVKQYLVGAYVHGSSGTYEENNYSDLDALVILKDETVYDYNKLSEAGRLLCNARCFMMRMDPLQHHGWFVMTESDLKNYDETYFPSELFRHAKSLFENQGSELVIKSNPAFQDYRSPFKNLCNSIIGKLEQHQYPENLYELKNLFSEFMLLPALYVQARDKRGIFKKFSFLEAGKDFSQHEWLIMDEVSSIRKKWNVEITGWRRSLITSPVLFSFNLAKLLSPPVSQEIKSQVNDGFYKAMLDFTNSISKKIQ